MDRPTTFGEFLLFQQHEPKPYGHSYRAGIVRGKVVDRIVRLERFDGDAVDRERLWRRLEQARDIQPALTDPHIAAGAGVGIQDGIPFAAYDFELGATLAKFLSIAHERSFPVPLDQALFVVERVALALSAAYQTRREDRPIVHSFLSPHSVLLSNRGDVKVFGFELGAALREQLADHPAYAPYLSPEVQAGEPPADNDDVYGLGSLLYELITGTVNRGEATDLDRIVVQATGDEAPEGLGRLLRGSLAPRGSRLPSVLAWQQALGKLILDGEYNPTTFNLAFLLHTLLRDTLEQDVEALKRERGFILESPKSEEEETTQIENLPIADAPVDSPPTSPGTVRLLVGTGSERRPFWMGFGLSALTVGVVAVLMAQGTGPAASEPNAIEYVTRPSAASSPVAGASDAGLVAAPEAETATDGPVIQTEIVNGGLAGATEPSNDGGTATGALDESEVDRLVAERAQAIEQSLKSEYERELARLRSEMKARSSSAESGAPARPAEGSRPAQKPVAEVSPPPSASAPAPAPTLDEPEAPPAAAARPSRTPSDVLFDARETEPTLPLPPARTPASPSTEPPVLTEGRASEARDPEPAAAPEPADKVVRTPAALVRLGNPIYPAAARRLGLARKVRVKVLVNPKGRVQDAEVIGPEVGHGFDAAALAAVRRSRWQAATEDGEPVSSWNQLTIEFKP